MSYEIAFLGCGSINEAILAGLLAAGIPKTSITATVRRRERAQELARSYGITVLATAEDADANQQAVRGASLAILGVKPVDVSALAEEVAPTLPRTAVVVSVAAGVTLSQLEHVLPLGQPVIRAMPNTPSRVGRGVISISGGTNASHGQIGHVKKLLATLGLVVQVIEEQIDAVTAVSGSGPAYTFYLVEAMANAGVELGLDRNLSALLARETVAGAGYMLAEPDADPATLLQSFTGPDGITGRAIDTFDKRGLPGILANGARAALERSKDLTRELTDAIRTDVKLPRAGTTEAPLL